MRILQTLRQRRDQYWEQQAQIDRYERMVQELRELRELRENLASKKLTAEIDRILGEQ